MRLVDWTSLAERDLEAIDDYWMDVSDGHADRVLERIRSAANFLAGMPRAGPMIDMGPARKWRVAATQYILLYRVLDDVVQILRVHHGREDWTRL